MGAGISLGEVLPPSIAHPDRLSGFLGATDDRSVTSVRSENRVDSRLSDFLARAESVLARLEPLLPAVREAVDWERSLAARWHRRPQRLAAAGGQPRPAPGRPAGRRAAARATGTQHRQFVAGQPASALLWGPAGPASPLWFVRCWPSWPAPAAPDRDRARPPGRPAAGGRATARPAAALRAVLRRPLVRCRGRRLPGTQERARRLAGAGAGVLLYATSNRRHLVSEKQSDNENWKMVDGELHPTKRWRTRSPCPTVSACCRSIPSPRSISSAWFATGWTCSRKAGLAWSWSEELEKEAIRWALGRGNRNGRCAYQFSRYWVGKQLLERQA